jgi:hypothetical protein
MKKTVLTFGLVAGSVIIVYSAAVFLFFGDFAKMSSDDFSRVEKLGYLRYIILALTIVFSIRYLKKQQGGEGSFKQLFLAGVYTALVVATMVGLMEMAYILINPDFMEQYATLTTARMKAQGVSAAEIASHQSEIESMKWLASPAAMGVFYFAETAAIGTVLSLIAALVMRTKKLQPVIA